jgi:hypothetical protein
MLCTAWKGRDVWQVLKVCEHRLVLQIGRQAREGTLTGLAGVWTPISPFDLPTSQGRNVDRSYRCVDIDLSFRLADKEKKLTGPTGVWTSIIPSDWSTNQGGNIDRSYRKADLRWSVA